jgi:hypothetical protein
MIPQKFEVFADNLGPGSERLPMRRPDCEERFDLESTARMRLHIGVASEPVSSRSNIREMARLREIAKGSY